MKLKLTKGKLAIIAMMVIVVAMVSIWGVGQKSAPIARDMMHRVAEGEEAQPSPEPVEDGTPKVAEVPIDAPAPESDISNPSDQTSEVKPTASTKLSDAGQEPIQKDPYQTDPVPKGKPLPVEPEAAVMTDKAMTCSLTVRCESILDHMEQLDQEKVELVPSDGMIFTSQEVTFYEGESVFNVLQREMKKAKIHLEFVNTPVFNSAYIEGIHNLYEFDCGELSGWMYKVNDWFPNYGCSRYQLKAGDDIQWVYTCDLGRDIGGDQAIGGTSDE